ncbi:ABC transporter substrate-binding protein [Haladaptatus halobius]|uniref:ABC transporter substrate-binding protein n=1 Tax=Haladaptatus halobius TaxID=2884875 RepID=UPI001D09EEDC|nr:ABC transporter substrate-binding protein [Haladaptatus halobius]
MSSRNVKNEVNRRSILKLTGTAGVAGLAGCLGGNGSGQSTNKPLEVLHGWTGGDGKEAINALTKGFKKKHSEMKTDFRPIGGGGNANLDAVVAKRLGNNNSPSSFAGWPGANLQKYKGALGDVGDPVWKKANLEKGHVKEAQRLCKFDGKYVAVPIGSHRMNNLFYNKKVVSDAGVDPNSITSLDALFKAMDKVKQKTNAVPMAHAMKSPWTTLQLWAAVMLGQEGFDQYMSYTKGNGNKGAVRRTFETTKRILSNYINNDASSIDFTTANQKIMNGEAAFIHQGNWVAGAYKGSGFKYDKDWGWTAFPGTEGMYGLHIDSFIYPGNNPSPDKSHKWLRYVGSKEAQVKFNSLKGSIPTRKDVKPSEFDRYLAATIEDFKSAKKKPPTLAHGLAVSPNTMTGLEGVISNNFSGPYNVSAATDGMLKKVK